VVQKVVDKTLNKDMLKTIIQTMNINKSSIISFESGRKVCVNN